MGMNLAQFDSHFHAGFFSNWFAGFLSGSRQGSG